MKFKILLLNTIHLFRGERTVSAILHLFNGKRSGQTLQDIEYYNLKPYFSILPKLKKEVFMEYINNLLDEKLLHIDTNSLVSVTDSGVNLLQHHNTKFHFKGWEYRGNELIFFSRLSLIVQTLSHSFAKDLSFIPIQKNDRIQLFVKRFFSHYPYREESYIQSFKKEVEVSIEKCGMDDTQKAVLVHRLSGYNKSGWTWHQLSLVTNEEQFDLYCSFIECLHIWLDFFEGQDEFPILNDIAKLVKVETYLTDSASKTAKLFHKGFSAEQIAEMRSLKLSTIEDHLVEMAINVPLFPIERFIKMEDYLAIKRAAQTFQTMKLRTLKEHFPHLTYFQLRLGLAYNRGDEVEQYTERIKR